MSIDIYYIAFDSNKADARWAKLSSADVCTQNKEVSLEDLMAEDVDFGTVVSGYIDEGKSEYVMVDILSNILFRQWPEGPTRHLVVKATHLSDEQTDQAISDIKRELNLETDEAKEFLNQYLKNISEVATALEADKSLHFVQVVNGGIYTADQEIKNLLQRRAEELMTKYQ